MNQRKKVFSFIFYFCSGEKKFFCLPCLSPSFPLFSIIMWWWWKGWMIQEEKYKWKQAAYSRSRCFFSFVFSPRFLSQGQFPSLHKIIIIISRNAPMTCIMSFLHTYGQAEMWGRKVATSLSNRFDLSLSSSFFEWYWQSQNKCCELCLFIKE